MIDLLLAAYVLLWVPLAAAQPTVATIAVGTTPVALAVNPVTHNVYVVNHGSASVTIIDGKTLAAHTISVEDRPEGIAINPATNTIYVANSGADSVSVIDGSTGTVSMKVHVGSYPLALAINTTTNRI